MKRKPLSGRKHSYVSPSTGLKGFPPALVNEHAYADTANAATYTYRNTQMMCTVTLKRIWICNAPKNMVAFYKGIKRTFPFQVKHPIKCMISPYACVGCACLPRCPGGGGIQFPHTVSAACWLARWAERALQLSKGPYRCYCARYSTDLHSRSYVHLVNAAAAWPWTRCRSLKDTKKTCK